jgi:hypothetical protein
MGYYLGYALSLYGREQDRLSHVLVSGPFENNKDFYYPTPCEHAVHVQRDGKHVAYDSRNAIVDLAEIPFVRMRDGLPERLRSGDAGFGMTVAAANRSQGERRLALDVERRTASADDELIDVGPTQFAVLLWLATRARQGRGAVDWSKWPAAEEFMKVAKRVLNPMSGEYERIEKALAWRRPSAIRIARYFEPHKSRINAALKDVLGNKAALRYCIGRMDAQGDSPLYFLPLSNEQIAIHDKAK